MKVRERPEFGKIHPATHVTAGSPVPVDSMKNPSAFAPVKRLILLAAHRNWLPKTDLPPAPGSTSRILTYDTKTDEAVWENRTVKRGDPIPE